MSDSEQTLGVSGEYHQHYRHIFHGHPTNGGRSRCGITIRTILNPDEVTLPMCRACSEPPHPAPRMARRGLEDAMQRALHGWRPMRWYWRRAAKNWAIILAEARRLP